MKKLTVMAACAALLLGGGVFVKVFGKNNLSLTLLDNIAAITFCEDITFWESQGRGILKEHQLDIDGAYIYDNYGRLLQSIEMFECVGFSWDTCDESWQKTIIKNCSY